METQVNSVRLKNFPHVTTCHSDQTMHTTGSTTSGCCNAAVCNLLRADSFQPPTLPVYFLSFMRMAPTASDSSLI